MKHLIWIIGLLVLLLPIAFAVPDNCYSFDTDGTDNVGGKDLTKTGTFGHSSTAKVGNGSVYFDGGNNDYYQASTTLFANIGSKSLSFWVEGTNLQNILNPMCLITETNGDCGSFDGLGVNVRWELTAGNNGRLSAYYGNTVQDYYFTANTGTGFNTGWTHVAVVQNGSTDLRIYINGVLNATDTTTTGTQGVGNSPTRIGEGNDLNMPVTANIDEMKFWNTTALDLASVLEDYNSGNGVPCAGGGETPPTILSYNLSTPSADCTSWPSGSCSTADSTPTVMITTDENADCAFGLLDKNYTYYSGLGVNRSCENSGTQSLICTLRPEDELVYEDNTLYITCRDSSGNENTTSTSGQLSLTLSGLESGSEEAIEAGIENALVSGYTLYNDQQVYARKLDGTQGSGRFDRVAKKGTKVWAFNHITKGEEHVGMFNLTPVLYVLEMANITNSTIINTVELMINATK